jgi:HK97 family phage prohead protease
MELAGTAIVFDSPSEDLGGFTEIVKFQAVQKSLQRNSDMFMLWQHDSAQPLSCVKTGTLHLTLTPASLDFVATLPNSPLGQNAFQAIADGTVDSVSFGFNVEPGGDNWLADAQGNVTRELLDINISEISPVTWAAYQSPHVSVRSAPADIRSKLKVDPEDEDDDSDDEEIAAMNDKGCYCDCDECQAGNCEDCTNDDCDDDSCEGCPMQDDLRFDKMRVRNLFARRMDLPKFKRFLI